MPSNSSILHKNRYMSHDTNSFRHRLFQVGYLHVAQKNRNFSYVSQSHEMMQIFIHLDNTAHILNPLVAELIPVRSHNGL